MPRAANKYGNAVRGLKVRMYFQGLYKSRGISPRYRNTSSATRRGIRTPCASNVFCKFAHTDIAQVGSVLCGAQKKEKDTH